VADHVDKLSDAFAEKVTITEQGEQVISHRDPFEIPEVGSEFNFCKISNWIKFWCSADAFHIYGGTLYSLLSLYTDAMLNSIGEDLISAKPSCYLLDVYCM